MSKKSSGSLSLPDDVGKEKDSVGVAQVVACGVNRSDEHGQLEWQGDEIKEGNYIAYMPFTDVIIPHGFKKLNLVKYANILAIAKGESK